MKGRGVGWGVSFLPCPPAQGSSWPPVTNQPTSSPFHSFIHGSHPLDFSWIVFLMVHSAIPPVNQKTILLVLLCFFCIIFILSRGVILKDMQSRFSSHMPCLKKSNKVNMRETTTVSFIDWTSNN